MMNGLEPCRAWLDWAAAQIDASLAKDEAARADLLQSLGRALHAGTLPSNTATGQIEMPASIVGVAVAAQAHDRVSQQLSHVATLLRALRGYLHDSALAQSADGWSDFAQRQMSVFSTPEERELFGRMVANTPTNARADEVYGEIEFFDELAPMQVLP